MGMNLSWRPVKKGKCLGRTIMNAMFEKYGRFSEMKLDHENIDFLEGLKIAGIKEADDLISAIETYGTIEVFTE